METMPYLFSQKSILWVCPHRPVSVKFKMDNYGGVRIPKSGGDKSLSLNNVD
jgi:hypothetical protein